MSKRKLTGPKPKMHYRNKAEEAFRQLAVSKGWLITKQGWFDFICSDGEEIFFVEVKPHGGVRLKHMQQKLQAVFHNHGIRSGKWSPDNPNPPWLPGFRRF